MANILGINLSELSLKETKKEIEKILDGRTARYVVTPNPEIILASHKDEELFYILNKADISLADGFGLKIAGLVLGEKIHRITGADITPHLLELAREKKLKVAILNWRGGLSRQEEIKDILEEKYSNINLLVIDIDRSEALDRETVDRLNIFKADILLNTLGSPYQEKSIYHNLSRLEGLKLAIGVGGSIDFITKKAIRAPRFMRYIGLEWLWRLLRQPKRIGRIYRATWVFFSKVITAKFINPLRWRSNVACLLYKREGEKIKILMVEREDEVGHWQMPQGGTDGESVKKAGQRELSEELGTDRFIYKASFKKVYKYNFLDKKERKAKEVDGFVRPPKMYKFDFKGQKQSLYIAKFIGQDSDIEIQFWDHSSYKWVEMDEVLDVIHPVRREAMEIFLNKFKSII